MKEEGQEADRWNFRQDFGICRCVCQKSRVGGKEGWRKGGWEEGYEGRRDEERVEGKK